MVYEWGHVKLAGAAIIGVLQMGIVILAGCNNWGMGGSVNVTLSFICNVLGG